MKWPEQALKWKGALGKYRYALLVAAVGVILLALPTGGGPVCWAGRGQAVRRRSPPAGW